MMQHLDGISPPPSPRGIAMTNGPMLHQMKDQAHLNSDNDEMRMKAIASWMCQLSEHGLSSR